MKKLIGLLLLIPVFAFADMVTWVPPTEREDDTVLDSSEIAGYNIYNEAGTRINQAPITDTQYDVDRIRTGPQTLYVTTMDTDGRESVLSTQAVIIPQLELAPPKPPSMFERLVAAIRNWFAMRF